MGTDLTSTAPEPDAERDWWLRVPLVLQSPRPVFVALRDDSREAGEARQEPITALVILAGIAAFLLEPSSRTLMDRGGVDGLTAAVLVFIGGALSGVLTYWLGGAAVLAGAKGAGIETTYRQARHVVAFAAAPIALSLFLVWPVRLSLYGSDIFRSGGSDSGTGPVILDALDLAFAAWSLALLVVGLRVTYRLAWRRVPLALVLTALALGALLVLAHAFFGGLGGA